MKDDAHGSWLWPARIRRVRHRLVITAWLPVPLHELWPLLSLTAGFHASLTVWFGTDLARGGLEEGGPPSRLIRRLGSPEQAIPSFTPTRSKVNGDDDPSPDAGQVRTTRRISMTLGRTCMGSLSSNLPMPSLR